MMFRSQLLFFLFLGFALSLFIFFPIHDFMSYHEYVRGVQVQTYEFNSSFAYVAFKFFKIMTGQRLIGTFIFGLVGILAGFISYLTIRKFYQQKETISNFQEELHRDISFIIAQGESSRLEFKSSFRWDLCQEKVNKNLEHAVMKTIAAFMNTEGGSLLIGVNDSGQAVGLEHDYVTLKSKNRDGFEVALMTAIATRLGTAHCSRVTILFHTLDGHDICHVLVPKAAQPIFSQNGKQTQFFLRAGAGTKELNVKEATEYIAGHWS